MSSLSRPSKIVTQDGTCASAPANIALVKYWGKRNRHLNLPVSDSIAVCLDSARSFAEFGPGQGAVYWNERPLASALTAPYHRLCAAFGSGGIMPATCELRIRSGLPARVGLASSSAAFAACAGAIAYGMDPLMSEAEMSVLARTGSGSACRSIPDGFTRWHRGQRADGTDSHAVSIAGPDHWPELRIITVELSCEPKRFSSTEGMLATAATSPLFQYWSDLCNSATEETVTAIRNRDFSALSELACGQARALHALCLTTSPPLLYLLPESVTLLTRLAVDLAGFQWLYTFDAGPNPILVTLQKWEVEIREALSVYVPEEGIRVFKPGLGVRQESCPRREDFPDAT
jgi:diphosphomevalonate decarboxylase